VAFAGAAVGTMMFEHVDAAFDGGVFVVFALGYSLCFGFKNG
jgi:hypothetical protein